MSTLAKQINSLLNVRILQRFQWIIAAHSSPCTSDDAFFRLNVGGKSYRIRIETIQQKKESSLLNTLISGDHSQRMAIVDAYIPETGEYYIERNSKFAEHILDYYITGLLLFTTSMID